MSEKLMNCPICKNSEIKSNEFPDSRDIYFIQCSVCGCYEITWEANKSSLLRDDLFILSGIIKHATENQQKITITTSNIDTLIKSAIYPKTVAEQLSAVISFIGDRGKSISDIIEIHPKTDYPYLFLRSEKDFYELLIYCDNIGYIEAVDGAFTLIKMKISGWDEYDKARKIKVTNPTLAFMAMRYGNKEHDKIFAENIRPAIKATGFDIYRLDERPAAGLIDNRMRVDILNCRFLIADLTDENRGAYWEAGYAEGLGKPVIYMCRKKETEKLETHFDVNHHTTVFWDEDNIEIAMENLKATIRATFPAEAKMSG